MSIETRDIFFLYILVNPMRVTFFFGRQAVINLVIVLRKGLESHSFKMIYADDFSLKTELNNNGMIIAV